MLVNAVLMKLRYKKPPLSPPTLQKHHPFESTLGSGVLLPFVHQPIPTQDCTFLLATLPAFDFQSLSRVLRFLTQRPIYTFS